MAAARAQQDAQQDAQSIVAHALIATARDLNYLKDYIFVEDKTITEFGKGNQPTKTTVEQDEHFFIHGEPLERKISVDNRPLDEAQRAKQERAIDTELKYAESHPNRVAKRAEKASQDELAMRHDVAEGFNFTQLGQVPCGDLTCYKIGAEPKIGYRGKSSIAALIPYLHGTLLIDTRSGEWVSIDATPVAKVGGGPVYINPDSVLHLRQATVAPGLWVLVREDFRSDARLLWDHRNQERNLIFGDFRKFNASVRILGAEATTSAP